MKINFSKESGLITYVIDEKITTNDMLRLKEARNQLSNHLSLKVLAVVTSFGGYDSFHTFKNALMGDFNMLPKLSKYAIVTDIAWLRTLIKFLNYAVPKSELKAFPLRNRKSADKWLE